ncbi:AbrB family transcriptional regulator [Thermus scotoductus]|uniref:AbrB family transcriptional regulator n=3 Tax=Thermus TaxID=270 RepID=A0A7V4ANG8_9DEIN|nr:MULTISPECIES: AbrB/MazE/SpoVT family DNA-binding domain-containing protein [Thermus]KHG65643.1 AbrB family transcriptional regulator [Thermus sp. 2.9]RTG93088.1 AbrB family transcriptional regulator [Thermus scotoductus]RTH06393.1 AbrB family transcriptional regulator [Thermus scotoductus]RTH08245.1 AbrB family transcriptional regulator [Thermus scotoductus]RTH08983.1 AbrB family transcriptional regulator [Thermus scotoductus]
MTYLVGPKGQVVIAKEIRERLGIGPGWRVVQRLAGDHVELYFLPPPHQDSLKGLLRESIRRTLPEEAWSKARETAWKASWQEEA